MYQYKINLPFKVESCVNCPFRQENMIFENVESQDKLTGIISIHRRTSFCRLKEEPVLWSETVEVYNSKCPLKGNAVLLHDNKVNKA